MVYMSMSTQSHQSHQTIQSIKNQINTKLLKLSSEKFREFNKSETVQDQSQQVEPSDSEMID